MATKHSKYYDIAIVGGGISGIYSAWRLLQADREDPKLLRKWKKDDGPLKIAVFEGSKRIGGRLLSVQPKNFEGTNLCEIGGMRFMVPNHYVVASLVEHLKFKCYQQVVESIPSSIPSSPPGSVYLNWNVLYLRGKMLRLIDEFIADSLPYNLTPQEKSAISLNATPPSNSQDLIGWAMTTIMPQLNKILAVLATDYQKGTEMLEKFLKTHKINGKHLYEIGYWNLLSMALSNEGLELALKTVGYDCLGGNFNSYNSSMENLDFTSTSSYYMLNDGYDAVPWTLQKQFEKMGGHVITGHWLDSFDETTLENGKKGVELTFNKKKDTVKAGAIILAMPRRSIELLAQKGPVLDPQRNPRFQYLMNAISPVPLFKMCLIYKEPWWQQTGVTQGRSMTDLPVRQVYYLASKGPNGEGMIMVYNDLLSSTYWSGYQSGPLGPWESLEWDNSVIHGDKDDHPLHIKRHVGSKMFQRAPLKSTTTQKGSKAESEFERLRKINWENQKAPDSMVQEMHRQLMLMHGVTGIPGPIDAAFADWDDDPYGGAVHFWNTGYKSWEIMKDMVKPVKDFPCFTCGEAWSEVQTWAEGALETAEMVLTGPFNLPTPKWLQNPPPPPSIQPTKSNS